METCLTHVKKVGFTNGIARAWRPTHPCEYVS